MRTYIESSGVRHEAERTQHPQGKDRRGKKGQTTAHVRIDIGGVVVTASITNESVDDLKLVAGQAAYAVVKSSDVMIAID